MPRFDSHARLLGAIALIAGTAAAWHYHLQQLTLSHYDAKAHLVVARRVLDSLTPGWAQIGAVWLPVPHLVQLLPVQVDWFYRTGAFAVAISVVCYAVTAAAIFATVRMLTQSPAAGAVGATIFAVNPNVLYLHSTPMTEPMFFALAALEVLLLTRWVSHAEGLVGAAREPPLHLLRPPRDVGWVMVLAILTRYEAWPITVAALAASAYAWVRRGVPVRDVLPAVGRLALYPTGAVIVFLCLSKVTVGAWFVTEGFFVPDQQILGQPRVILEKMLEGIGLLGGTVFVRTSVAASLLVAALALWRREKSALLIPLMLFAAAALPFYAYIKGHPFRIRYEVPLILAGAMAIGLGVGQLRRFAPAVALTLAILVVGQTRPLDPQAPMVQEAQADRRYIEGRKRVTQCLAEQYHGETILMSMNSLAHYMQELSAIGIGLSELVHEGNHPIWDTALERGPSALVGWVVFEERVGGGDVLFDRHRASPRFLDDFDRICEGGGVALYKRR